MKIRGIFLKILFILIGLVIIGYVAFTVSPWPAVLLIRYSFNKGGVKTNEALKKYVPGGIVENLDQRYDIKDKDALVDVYYQRTLANTDGKLPVIVWVHGGGWVAGDKGHGANYCKILADKGFVTASIDYSIAPEKNYPVPVRQLNNALLYLKRNAQRFHIDTAKFFLAGDSGGAQIAAEMGGIISSSEYAELVKISPTLASSQLSGVVLFCGPYDAGHVNLEGAFGSFIKTVLWSYSGKKNFAEDEYFKTLSVIDYVTRDYPACFISVGNGDPLAPHSYGLAKKLLGLGVPVDTLFFPAGYTPKLPHEYQFDLDGHAGQLALESMVRFLNRAKGLN